MQLKIENINVAKVVNFLKGLDLTGLKSIYRTNLQDALDQKLTVIAKNEKQLIEELKDDRKKLNEELEKFYKAKAVIDGGDSQVMFQSVKSVIKKMIEEETESFKDDNSVAVAILFEQFGLDKEITENKGDDK